MMEDLPIFGSLNLTETVQLTCLYMSKLDKTVSEQHVLCLFLSN
jgi:hypothetical protein